MIEQILELIKKGFSYSEEKYNGAKRKTLDKLANFIKEIK